MPPLWQEQQRFAAAAAALWGMSFLALSIATTEAALAAISAAPAQPKPRLITIYGQRLDEEGMK